jgi:phenylacetate-CoA ligase
LPAPGYFDALDYTAMIAAWGRPGDFPRIARQSRGELRARQEARFAAVMAFAWKVPFYRRLWGARGIEPGDIRSLDDNTRLPTCGKSDLMASLEAHSPLGAFRGLDAYPADKRPPLIFQTTSDRAPQAARSRCSKARKAARCRPCFWPGSMPCSG